MKNIEMEWKRFIVDTDIKKDILEIANSGRYNGKVTHDLIKKYALNFVKSLENSIELLEKEIKQLSGYETKRIQEYKLKVEKIIDEIYDFVGSAGVNRTRRCEFIRQKKKEMGLK